MRGGQLLFLRRQLARHAVAGIRDGLVQVAGAALHPLDLALFLEERRQQRAEAVRLRDIHQALILGDRQEREVKYRAVLHLSEQERLPAVILDIRHEIVVDSAKLLSVLVRHAGDGLGCISGRTERQLTAEQRRKAEQLTEQPAVERLTLLSL